MTRFAANLEFQCRPATDGQVLHLVSVMAGGSVFRKCDVKENAV